MPGAARLGVICAVALTLSACTGGDAPGAGSPSETASALPAPSVEGATSSPLFDDESHVLKVAIREAATLDPMRVRDPGSVLIVRQLFEGLTRWDPVEEQVLPAAAESWEVRDGGRGFVFHLRAGMTFHDGAPVTSDDFAYAFDRIAAKSNASDVAYTLQGVEGFAEVNQLGRSDHLAGVKTPDDLTLEIRLTEPHRAFPEVLTHPSLVPLEKAAVERMDSFLTSPVGNGPFQMARPWQVGDEVALKAFPGFIDTPELEGIRFLPFPDAAASWLQFLEGDLEVVEVPAGQIDSAAESFGDQGYVPLLAGSYYGLNLESRQLRGINKRKAISLAIDREAISSTIYKGTLQAARGVVPRGMPGFEEDLCVGLCDYEPERAAALVQKLPRGQRRVEIELTSFEGEPHNRVARAIKENLEAVGFTVTVHTYPFEAYLKRLREGRTEMYRLGWIAEYPDPDAFLSDLFRSDSPDNHSGYASDQVDRLLAEARGEPSEAKRTQLYIEAERAILADLPIVPIGSYVTHWAAQAGVEEIYFDQMGGFDGAEVRLER